MNSLVTIRPPCITDEAEFIAKTKASRNLHRPWVKPPANSVQFAAHIARMAEPQNHGFLVCEAATGQMAGVVNLTNVILGPFCCGFLGYYAFSGYERRGLMLAGLGLAVKHAFKTLKLHRLEANIQPGNMASIALAKSCGFSKEGYSPKYLKVGGRWRDHERWAMVAK